MAVRLYSVGTFELAPGANQRQEIVLQRPAIIMGDNSTQLRVHPMNAALDAGLSAVEHSGVNELLYPVPLWIMISAWHQVPRVALRACERVWFTVHAYDKPIKLQLVLEALELD